MYAFHFAAYGVEGLYAAAFGPRYVERQGEALSPRREGSLDVKMRTTFPLGWEF